MEKFVLSESRRQRQAHIATMLGAFVTAGSMVFGLLTYQRSAAEHRQTVALGLMQDYLKLAVEHPDLANSGADRQGDARYQPFATHALSTAELLWNLVGDDPKWERAIQVILREHRGYLERGQFACADYTPDFVTYMRSQLPVLKCAP